MINCIFLYCYYINVYKYYPLSIIFSILYQYKLADSTRINSTRQYPDLPVQDSTRIYSTIQYPDLPVQDSTRIYQYKTVLGSTSTRQYPDLPVQDSTRIYQYKTVPGSVVQPLNYTSE